MIQKAILVKTAAAVMGTALVAGAVVTVSHLSKVKDTYRSILLYEIEGTAKIEREGTGEFDGTENLYLESGDQLTVESESFTRLRLDEDKYVMVEENSALSIEAAGTREDSRTKIHLTKGAIINEIQNPLSAGSTYEVTTPNSIMAVRGTLFRVEVYYDENGEIFTKVSVFEGKVSSRLIYPDGTMEEEVITGNGREVIIHSNQELTEYLGEERDIKYEELPENILHELPDRMNKEGGMEGMAGEGPEKSEIPKEGESGEEAERRKEGESSEGAERIKEEESSQGAEKTKEEKGTKEETMQKESGARETAEESRVSKTMSAEESPAVPETAEETSMAAAETVPVIQAGRQTGSGNNSSKGGGNSGSSQTGERPAESTGEAPTETPAESTGEVPEYTVTFMHNGSVLGTQQVKEGQCATEPWLNPAAVGSWAFDFDVPITGDTTIQWNNGG